MSTPTRLIIQNGRFANDGNGDTLRDAAEKINNNFATLFSLYPGLDSNGSAIIDSDDLVHIAGDSMTGFLSLHANPVEDYHAASKAYVDQTVTSEDVIDASPSGGSTNDF